MKSLLLGLVLLFSVSSYAYELDTHCYDTYMMARKAGFNHQHALFLCTGAQWVDEGLSSTPMGGLIWGTMVRRIYHFPNKRFQKQRVTQDGHSGVASFTIAKPKHPVAYKLFDEGMKQGNWFKIGLSIHIVQDTFGHAGYTAEAGHAFAGHHPDRTWLAVNKYKQMTEAIFEMLVALRAVAPNEALDEWAQKVSKEPVRSDDATKLAGAHWKDAESLVARDYFKDPRFTPEAVNYILRRARVKGFFRNDFQVDQWLPKDHDYILSPLEQAAAIEKAKVTYTDGTPVYIDDWSKTRRDARDVLRRWVINQRRNEIMQGRFVKGSNFNMATLKEEGFAKLLIELEKIEDSNLTLPEKLAAYNELVPEKLRNHLVDQIVDFICEGEIPKPFDDFTKVQFEADGGPRTLEMALKISDRREKIAELYGKNILFEADTWLDRKAKKMQQKKEAEIQAEDKDLDLTLTPPESQILSQYKEEKFTFDTKKRWGVFFVKHGYNIRTAIETWKDIFNHILKKRAASSISHESVKDFQIAPLLNEKVNDKTFVMIGPVGQMSFLGVSKCGEALADSITFEIGARE